MESTYDKTINDFGLELEFLAELLVCLPGFTKIQEWLLSQKTLFSLSSLLIVHKTMRTHNLLIFQSLMLNRWSYKKKITALLLKVGQSSNFLYQGLAEKYFWYLLIKQSLKPKRKFGVILHHIEQWCNEVDLFALKLTFV